MDLIDLRVVYEESGAFNHFKVGGVRYVPGRGARKPTVMLLGESPNATDSLHGKPFSARAGRVLGALMGLAGLYADEEGAAQFANNSFITHMVKYKAPGGRPLNAAEVELSREWVTREWKVLGRPPVIVTLGAIPSACILRESQPISDIAGKMFPPPKLVPNLRPVIWPMYHPTYPLYNAEIRPRAEEHWGYLGAWLKKEGLIR